VAGIARVATAFLLALLVAVGGTLPPGGQVSAQSDSRYFPETGFRIDDDKIWDFFNKRGGKETFGLPTSRTFPFLGLPSQFFQRHVLQVQGGAVRTLNLLEDNLLPYTTISGTTFPSVDRSVVAAAPKPGSSSYGADVATYLDKYAPDTWEGEPVKFLETFSKTVSLADAFPDGGGNPDLLQLLNLEIWGLPTSKPARDPHNNGFIFLRFQRGVMHYDAGCKCTQGLLLGDALKAIITGQNLPDDLAAQAADSPLLGQYDMGVHSGPVHDGLPAGTELGNAFRPSLDRTPAAAAPVQSSASARSDGGSEGRASPTPAPTPKPSGPPTGDPKPFLVKVSEAGKGAKEQENEAKKGSDNQMVWMSNRIERDRTYANYNSGPVTIYSKAIIARDAETARKIFDDEVKLNDKLPEAKDKVGGKFDFNMEGDEDVGEQAKGLSSCVATGCNSKEGDNQIHRRMVFLVGPYVGVVYTFGMDYPEGNTQAYTRQFAQHMVKRMRDSL
jgi:hypothetical protein